MDFDDPRGLHQSEIPAPNRRAYVHGYDSAGNLLLLSWEGLSSMRPLSRPMVGSSISGWHAAPPAQAQVIVTHEVSNFPAAVITAGDALGTPGALAAGESALYHPDGRVLLRPKNDGTTTVWSKSGQPSTTVSATGAWSFGAGLAAPSGTLAKLQLAYNATTDLMTGTVLTGGVWTDLSPNQSFSVDQATSTVEVQAGGYCAVQTTAASSTGNCGMRLIIDSAGAATAYYVGGCWVNPALFANVLAGAVPVFINGLAAGTHTVKVQILVTTNTGNAIAYCRASTPQTVGECLRINVLEHKC